jgi:hypothetical protein
MLHGVGYLCPCELDQQVKKLCCPQGHPPTGREPHPHDLARLYDGVGVVTEGRGSVECAGGKLGFLNHKEGLKEGPSLINSPTRRRPILTRNPFL